eukprot:2823998-Prymnesium_polylepis.1
MPRSQVRQCKRKYCNARKYAPTRTDSARRAADETCISKHAFVACISSMHPSCRLPTKRQCGAMDLQCLGNLQQQLFRRSEEEALVGGENANL